MTNRSRVFTHGHWTTTLGLVATALAIPIRLSAEEVPPAPAAARQLDAQPPQVFVVETVVNGRGETVVEQVPAAAVQPPVPAIPLVPAEVIAPVAREVSPADNQGDDAGEFPVFVKKGDSPWRYWDRAEEPGKTWANVDFDDAEWGQGPGPLGYGDQHIKTKVAFGEQANEKRMVAYFRHTFVIEDPGPWRLAGAILCDDGAAVYLNGNEVYRRNLPAGELEPNTPASQAVSGGAETTFWEFLVDGNLLRKGANTVAVRVHQNNPTSSDLGFDLELRAISPQLARQMEQRLRPRGVVQGVVRPDPVPVAPPFRRSFTHVMDGTMQVVGPDGQPRQQRMDALEQARNQVPSAKFVRTIQGDTLAKLAAQYEIDVDQLALLNRAAPAKVYAAPDVACIAWTHTVQPGETLAELARSYNTTVETLSKLNGLEAQVPLQAGKTLTVPGEFSYHYRRDGYSYLRLARYTNPVRQVPYNQRSMKMRRKQLGPGQTLKDLADRLELREDFLRQMNGLSADDEPEDGRWLLVEYSVELNEDATLDQLAQFFNVPLERLLEVNQLEADADVPPGQRLEVPIGERLGGQQQAAGSGDEVQVYEVVLQPESGE